MAMDRERPRGRKRRKVCTFCVDKVEHIDYKDCLLYTSLYPQSQPG